VGAAPKGSTFGGQQVGSGAGTLSCWAPSSGGKLASLRLFPTPGPFASSSCCCCCCC
jgi:hypothetical protein